MSKRVLPLLPLQELDLQIFSLKKEQQKLPIALEHHRKRVQEVKSLLEVNQQDVKQLKLELAQKDLSLKEKEAKIQQLNVQSNQVRKNEEYQVIMKEITRVKADKSLLEDEILMFYNRIDEAEKKHKLDEAELRKVEVELATEQKRIEGENTQLQARITELEGSRDAHIRALDGEILKPYQRVLEAKADGLALARVLEGTCQGCMVGITSQDINLLMMGRDVIVCRNCSRILYLNEGA